MDNVRKVEGNKAGPEQHPPGANGNGAASPQQESAKARNRRDRKAAPHDPMKKVKNKQKEKKKKPLAPLLLSREEQMLQRTIQQTSAAIVWSLEDIMDASQDPSHPKQFQAISLFQRSATALHRLAEALLKLAKCDMARTDKYAQTARADLLKSLKKLAKARKSQGLDPITRDILEEATRDLTPSVDGIDQPFI